MAKSTKTTNGDALKAAAAAAAQALPSDIAVHALKAAKAAAKDAYAAAPPLPAESRKVDKTAPLHGAQTFIPAPGVKPALALPSDDVLLAVLAGPFAVNAERFVAVMARNDTPMFGLTSFADMTEAQRACVVQLVRVYNDTEQLLAARLAGEE